MAAEPDDAIAAELDFHAAVASHAPSLVRPVGRGRQDRVAPDQGGDAPVATAAPRILGVPGIVAATIFAFTVSWAAFLYPAAFIFGPAEMVVTESTEQPDVEKALAQIAPLPLPTRTDLGQAAHDLHVLAAGQVAFASAVATHSAKIKLERRMLMTQVERRPRPTFRYCLHLLAAQS